MGNNKKGNICGINQSKEHLKNIIKNEFMKVEKNHYPVQRNG
jgi:hypothetical protein